MCVHLADLRRSMGQYLLLRFRHRERPVPRSVQGRFRPSDPPWPFGAFGKGVAGCHRPAWEPTTGRPPCWPSAAPRGMVLLKYRFGTFQICPSPLLENSNYEPSGTFSKMD